MSDNNEPRCASSGDRTTLKAERADYGIADAVARDRYVSAVTEMAVRLVDEVMMVDPYLTPGRRRLSSEGERVLRLRLRSLVRDLVEGGRGV